MSVRVTRICIVLFLFFQESFGQKKQVDSLQVSEIDEVVITATRTPRQLSSLPLPVTLISKQTIDQTGVVRLDEILNEQTGIITVSDESGFAGIQIQGISSDYVMILIDGVPLVGRSAGNFDLSRITTGNIKQIEVVKGPSSSLYGSEALGGVINIITEKPTSEEFSGNLSYRLGSFTQQDVTIDFKQVIKSFRYSFFANRFSSNGYDLTPEIEGATINPFENYTLNARMYYDFSDALSLFGSTRFYYQNQDVGFSLDNVAYDGDTKGNEYNTHLRFDHKWNKKLNLNYEFYYTNYKAKETIVEKLSQEVFSESDFDQHLLRPEIRGTYSFTKAGEFVAGVGYQWEELDRTYFKESVDFNSQYIYAQHDHTFFDHLNIIAGIRFDNHSEYSNQLSPKLAVRCKIFDDFAFKASVGYGFKAPDFRQLYFDFTNSTVGYTVLGYNVALGELNELEEQGEIVNVVVPESELMGELKAESSIGYNIGVTYSKKKLSTEFNLFRNDFKNLIDTRIIARKTNGQNVFSYVNFDEVYTTGLEFNLAYDILQNLKISSGYQLLYAFDKAREQEIENEEVFIRDPETNETVAITKSDYFGLVNRSRHNINFKLSYRWEATKTNISARLIYRSKYGLHDTNGNGLLDIYDTSFVDGYSLTNFAVSKTIYSNLTFQFGINNVFDHTDTNIPSLNGRQFYGKINYQL
ncbi:TonB-dependent receptor plug domain-containing protein [Aquimarina pacifica]|uniref:TonB-dependent receptor plug domain-containing protein n=1 Tax=Aquimarina pacifica TaxID=1296415 RepID=UPI000471C9E3|nr:TonB-dependent receptor [Aquimarina pacifica]